MREQVRPTALLVVLVSSVLLPVPVAAENPVGEERQLVGGPYEGAPVETRFEANDAEVLYWVRRYGTDTERAIDIANWLADAAPLLTALPEQIDTYANARLIHGGSDVAGELPVGEIRVEIKAKHPTDMRLQGLVESLRTLRVGDFVAEVTVDRVPLTLAELDELAAAERARLAPALVDIEYDFDRGELIIRPPAEAEAGSHFASLCPNVTGGNLDGARRVELVDPSRTTGCYLLPYPCTVAFPMSFNSRYGITTAGHCLRHYAKYSSGYVQDAATSDADLYYVYTPDDVYVSGTAYWYRSGYENNGAHDIGFIRRSSTSTGYPARIWKWDTEEWRHIIGYEATNALVGMIVCQGASDAAEFGANTYCGAVDKEKTNYDGTTNSGNYTRVDFTQNPYGSCCGSGGGGSSGSPMYYGGFVYGTFSYGHFLGTYERIQSIQATMSSASSDVRFICYNATFCNPS